MSEIVEVEVFTLGELKALQHKGFRVSLGYMREWTYADAAAYAHEVIETTLHNMFGRDGLYLLSWDIYPPTIAVKGRVWMRGINWNHPTLEGLTPPINMQGAASFTVRERLHARGVASRATWDYDDMDSMSESDLLLSSETMESWFHDVMVRVLGEAIYEHDTMMSDDALVEHADDVGIQWLPDGRPLH